jgi:hypothetical protein
MATLAARPSTMADIDLALAPFLSTGTLTFQPVVDDLLTRGWVTGGYELTGEGRRVHDRVAEQVHAARAKAVEGISAEEYTTLIDLLRRVAANVEA